MTKQDDGHKAIDGQQPIGEGKNGEVYPCPDCGKHESVRWLPGDSYRYECTDCLTEFKP